MTITLPDDCGNSPRIGIVGDFVTAWGTGKPLDEWLHDEHSSTTYGPDMAVSATEGEVRSIVTHGRLASCDGYLVDGNEKIEFSHAIRFASASKTAKIVEIRSFIIRQ